jgi:hypothetical protein
VVGYITFGIIHSFQIVHCPVFKIKIKTVCSALMQQEPKYIVRPDRAKGLRTAFYIGFKHAAFSLTLLPEDRDYLCLRRSVA